MTQLMNETRLATRMKAVDDHVRHECDHNVEELVATFGQECQWYDEAGGPNFVQNK